MRATTMTSLKTMNTLAGRYGSKMRSIHVFLSIDYCFDACCCCCFSLRSLVARALSSNAIALASISISFSFKAFCLNSLDSRVVGTVEEALFLGVAYGDVLAKLRFISSLSSRAMHASMVSLYERSKAENLLMLHSL